MLLSGFETENITKEFRHIELSGSTLAKIVPVLIER
jgi:hypothetical protein